MPYCPVCREEFREGFTRCEECNAELVDELPKLEVPVWAKSEDNQPDWPLLENGKPDNAVFLVTARNTIDFEIKRALLNTAGIPVTGKIPNQTFFSSVLFGSAILGEDIYVPETMLDEAKGFLGAQAEIHIEEDA